MLSLLQKKAAMTVHLPPDIVALTLAFPLLPSVLSVHTALPLDWYSDYYHGPRVGNQLAWEDVQSPGFSFGNFFLCCCNNRGCNMKVVLDLIHYVIWIAVVLITKF